MAYVKQNPGPQRLEQIGRIHQALEATGGNITAAAKILGCKYVNLQARIQKWPELRARWYKDGRQIKAETKRVPTEIDALARECVIPLAETVSADEKQLERQLAIEEGRLQAGIAALGLTEKEKEYALAMTRFDREFFKDTIHMASSGAVRMSLKMQSLFDEMHKRLEQVSGEILKLNGDAPWDEKRRMMVEEEKLLTNSLIQISDQIRRIGELFYKGALVRAAVSGHLKPPIKRAKPGFMPHAGQPPPSVEVKPQSPNV